MNNLHIRTTDPHEEVMEHIKLKRKIFPQIVNICLEKLINETEDWGAGVRLMLATQLIYDCTDILELDHEELSTIEGISVKWGCCKIAGVSSMTKCQIGMIIKLEKKVFSGSVYSSWTPAEENWMDMEGVYFLETDLVRFDLLKRSAGGYDQDPEAQIIGSKTLPTFRNRDFELTK